MIWWFIVSFCLSIWISDALWQRRVKKLYKRISMGVGDRLIDHTNTARPVYMTIREVNVRINLLRVEQRTYPDNQPMRRSLETYRIDTIVRKILKGELEWLPKSEKDEV